MVVAGVPTGALVVFALIGVASILFVSEVIPNDVTLLGGFPLGNDFHPLMRPRIGIPRAEYDAVVGGSEPVCERASDVPRPDDADVHSDCF